MTDAEVLTEAVKRTFSEMAFIDVEPIDTEVELTDTSHIIEISYDAPSRGSFALLLPLACKRSVVENIYGEEWDSLDDEAIDDCLLELVNVLAGEYLRTRYGAEVKRELSLPRLVFDVSELSSAPRTEHCWFDAEGSPFLLIHGFRS